MHTRTFLQSCQRYQPVINGHCNTKGANFVPIQTKVECTLASSESRCLADAPTGRTNTIIVTQSAPIRLINAPVGVNCRRWVHARTEERHKICNQDLQHRQWMRGPILLTVMPTTVKRTKTRNSRAVLPYLSFSCTSKSCSISTITTFKASCSAC